jgi:hypothetical protein
VHVISYCLAGLVALSFAHDAVSALSQQTTEIGLLTCGFAKGDEGKSEAEGGAQSTLERQTRDLLCVFRPTGSEVEETNTGSVESVGSEKALSEQRVVIWVVKGSREAIRSPGLLQQVYAADPAANPGHSPALIGEASRSLVLQPFADSQSPALTEGKPQTTAAVVVAVSLILRSAPA